jgi:hypothetical protein
MNVRVIGSVIMSSAILGAGLAFGPGQKAAPKKKLASVPQQIDFNRDVRPILSEHCYKCHGPDAKEAKGGLRLSDPENVHKTRDGYKIFDSKKVDDSELIKRILARDALQMPPKDSGAMLLTKEQVEVLKQWIKAGAKYEKHWAFVPPKLSSAPSIKNKSQVKNDIDRFLLAALEKKGMKFEEEADRTTLLRRASLTLTGLVPTESDRQLFENDKKPDAFERAVDRILSSERYGEHQARFWLDAVRYGDTHGLHLDNERSIYPYRDWVVRAMNQDLPFNQFTEWQLAGDMLKNATLDQKVASGYIRMNPTTAEGGAIEEEFLVKNTQDRVDTTSTIFLGLTVACAKCHDHKYDPISTKDYYSMFAYFNSTKDAPMDGNQLLPEPSIQVPLPQEQKEMELIQSQNAETEKKVDIKTVNQWIKDRKAEPLSLGQWEVSDTKRFKTFDEAYDQEFTPTKWMKFNIELGKGLVVVNAENAAAYVRTILTATSDRRLSLFVGSDDSIKVWLNGKLVHQNRVFRGVDGTPDEVVVDLKKGDNTFLAKVTNGGGPDGFKFNYGTKLDRDLDMAAKDPAKLKQLYILNAEGAPDTARYRKNQARYDELTARIPRTLVAQEMEKPRDSYVLKRGEYNLRAEKVGRSIPKALGLMPKSAPNNRLGLAKWLTDPTNPLVSRVFVNRIWQQHFGTGIVKTAEDFGNQGEWPSHPELLDYLAVKFIQDGWSMKKLHKMMVTSRAFRQKSTITKQKLQLDPENRLISRGPRFRLDAEVLRDQVLQVSGLLVNREGGRGFKPYQPAGLWEEIGFAESNTSRYAQDMDSSIYRRTLYLFWKRTSPHPFMSSFDAPTREACVVRRPRTNTPLQALITLNEPAFFESARVFAEKSLATPGDDGATVRRMFRNAVGRYPSATEQKVLLASLKRNQSRFAKDVKAAESIATFGMAPKNKTLNTAQVASYTMIASTIFNLDEFLTQH